MPACCNHDSNKNIWIQSGGACHQGLFFLFFSYSFAEQTKEGE